MNTAQDLSRITARLVGLGLTTLLNKLLQNDLSEPFVIEYREPKSAKTVQRYLYNWLAFHPTVKVRTTIRVNYSTITVLRTSSPERRGRKGGRQIKK